jgi:hypothetical protein
MNLEIKTEGGLIKVPVNIDIVEDKVYFHAETTDHKRFKSVSLKKLTADATAHQLLIDKREWRSYLYVELRANYESRKKDFRVDGRTDSIELELRGEVTFVQLAGQSADDPVAAHRTTAAGGSRRTYYNAEHGTHGWPEVGFRRGKSGSSFMRESECVRALVPDTPENRAAFVSLRRNLDRLTVRLIDLMRPENVQATLDSINANPTRLLPAPQEKKP